MFGFIKSHLDNNRKEEHERKLKQALAEKFKNFEPVYSTEENTDYTTVEFNGEVLRLAKEHITVFDIDAPPLQI